MKIAVRCKSLPVCLNYVCYTCIVLFMFGEFLKIHNVNTKQSSYFITYNGIWLQLIGYLLLFFKRVQSSCCKVQKLLSTHLVFISLSSKLSTLGNLNCVARIFFHIPVAFFISPNIHEFYICTSSGYSLLTNIKCERLHFLFSPWYCKL